jgi:prophage antirepressor-like protein
VAKDVIRCLSLTHQNTTIHTAHLRDDERVIVDRASISQANRALFSDPKGGASKFTIVSESGLPRSATHTTTPTF